MSATPPKPQRLAQALSRFCGINTPAIGEVDYSTVLREPQTTETLR